MKGAIRFCILVFLCLTLVWRGFVRQQVTTPLQEQTADRKDLKLTNNEVEADIDQESLEIPVDFCWSTEPIDAVYLLDKDEYWNSDLLQASLKGVSLYLPWLRTSHIFGSKDFRDGFLSKKDVFLSQVFESHQTSGPD